MPTRTNILDRPKAVALLMQVHEKEPMRSGCLFDLESDYVHLMNLARDMEQLGLMKIEIVGLPKTHVFTLTDSGREVAKDLETATNKIYGSIR